MANITVAELLIDPDFVDPVQVVRNVETIGNDGVVAYTPTTYDILASIQSNTLDLVMQDSLTRTSGTYEIITTFPLETATGDNIRADTVLWKGAEWVVTSVERFGNFAAGAGHYEGIMTLKTVSPVAGPP